LTPGFISSAAPGQRIVCNVFVDVIEDILDIAAVHPLPHRLSLIAERLHAAKEPVLARMQARGAFRLLNHHEGQPVILAEASREDWIALLGDLRGHGDALRLSPEPDQMGGYVGL
jgi:hypothetical protein